MVNKPHLTFVEQLKQNPLIFTMVGCILGGASKEIERFTRLQKEA